MCVRRCQSSPLSPFAERKATMGVGESLRGDQLMTHSAVVGAILGTAVGDALGLPYENLSRRRGVRLLGEPDRHRFFFGRGMVSDDTEHTCLVAQALLASGGDAERFSRQLGWRLRWWLLSLPVGLGR